MRKATVSFIICPSARLFVRMEQVRSHHMDFHKTKYVIVFRKCVEKIQVLLKSQKNNGYFTRPSMHICEGHSFNSS